MDSNTLAAPIPVQDSDKAAAMAAVAGDLIVHAFDVALMHSACRWTLDDRAGRKASAAWLRKTYERLLLEALKPEVFWELGAFNAAFSRRLHGTMPGTIYHAFEANPYPFEKFREEVTRDGINYHHLALGPENGTAVFKIGRTLGDRELAPDMGCNSILTKSGDRTYEDATVEMVAVDSFAAQHGLLAKSSAVWIDAEGFAFQVLQGMRETLKSSSFVFIEVEDRQLWEGQKTAVDIKRFLFEEGFVPILRDFEFKQQYNVLFARIGVYERADVRLILTEALQAVEGGGAAAR
jgi:FkbM family methyltransferase